MNLENFQRAFSAVHYPPPNAFLIIAMLNVIKHRLRHLKAQKKYVFLIDCLVRGNALVKTMKQRVHKSKAKAALESADFGNTPEQWVEFVWYAADGFFRPLQKKYEITNLIKQLQRKEPKSLLEIGTANGGSLFLFCQVSAPDATIVSIDLPGGINGGGFPNWKTGLYQRFAKPQQSLHLLRLNSHHDSTIVKAKKTSPNGRYDVIMIDGDHSYEGVKQDFERYKELVAEGGMIILHDVLENRFDPLIKVHQFWNEIKALYPTTEIIFDRGQGNMGIGVVYFGD